MIKKIFILMLGLAALAACKQSTDVEPEAEVQAIAAALRVTTAFSTDRTHYQPADTVSLRLENTTNREIGYNLCSSTLQIEQGDDWRDIPSLKVCTAALYPLAPQQHDIEPYALDDTLAAGTYRFMSKIYLLESRANSKIYSNSFTVE